jgi:hypothetical protein
MITVGWLIVLVEYIENTMDHVQIRNMFETKKHTQMDHYGNRKDNIIIHKKVDNLNDWTHQRKNMMFKMKLTTYLISISM